MSQVFLDTSAALALLNPRDEHHDRACRAFHALRAREAILITTSYVLAETYALLLRRMGIDALREFRDGFAPLCQVVWVDEAIHEAGLDLILERRHRSLSLVDAISFVVMRQRRVDEAFAFDTDFDAEGFRVLS